MNKKFLLIFIMPFMLLISLTNCSSVTAPPTNKPSTKIELAAPQTTLLDSSKTIVLEGSPNAIWEKLQHTSTIRLIEMQKQTGDASSAAWVQLALISKRNNANTKKLAPELLAWRERYPNHPGNQLIPNNATLNQLLDTTPPQRIAILLPQHGTYSSSGQWVREGFLNAYYANLTKVGDQNVKFYDTTQTSNLSLLYKQAIADGADIVIGPLTKEEVQKLKASTSFNAATLALNYSEVNAASLPSNFYEFGLLPEDEAIQIADRAYEAGLSRAIVIAPQNGWGRRLSAAFTSEWQAKGGNVQDAWFYTAQTNFNTEVARLLNVDPTIDKQLMKEDNDKEVLSQQRRHDFDVIFLFSQAQDARIIVPLLRFYYTDNIPIYSTSSVYTGKADATSNRDLNGVIICDVPWNMHPTHKNSQDSAQSNRLYAVGQDAYLLSQSLTRLKQLPNFPIYGKTGALTLSNNHQVHRRLPCKTIPR